MNSLCALDPFEFGEAQDFKSLLQSSENNEEVNNGKQNQLFGLEDWEVLSSLFSEYNFYQGNTSLPPNHVHFDVISPPIESCTKSEQQDFVLSKKEKPSLIPSASLKLLHKYRNNLNKFRSGQKRLNREEFDEKCSETTCVTNVFHRRLSTEEVVRVAGSWYIHVSSQKDDDSSMAPNPLSCVVSGLDDEEIKDVRLVWFLLVSAEKVGNKHFYLATKVLTRCDHLSASTSNPVQRVVYYFAKALQKRIHREMRITPFYGLHKGEQQEIDLEETMMSLNPVLLTYHQELPFYQVVQFPGIQVIIDEVASEKKIHLIDLGIRTGMHWTILIQALASRYENLLEFLKISAVGKPKQQAKMEETGKWLSDFANAMKFKLSFEVIIVSDMKDLKEDLFVIEADEAVVVYSPMLLRTMLPWPDRLNILMGVITKLQPCVMVVTETEANENSSSFFNRFTEALFHYSALFDCLEASTNENNRKNMNMLAASLGEGIMNIVAMEGEERTTRSVGIDVWRAFFARFGIVETELSQTSLFQARMILKKFSTASDCTLAMNGECLTVGWKETPLHSLSAWKFH